MATGAGGGGLFNVCGFVQLANDTFEGDRAVAGFGGAIADSCSSSQVQPNAPFKPGTSLDFVTIADNAAGAAVGGSAGGAGLAILGDVANVMAHDTLIANGANNAARNCQTFQQKIVSVGHNLEDASDCGLNGPADLIRADPKLGPLRDNGGPTETMALPAGSPAVDAAGPACDVLADQRAITRPEGGGCDIGAFELVPVAASPAPVTTPTPSRAATALPRPPVTGAEFAAPSSGVPAGLLLLALGLLFAAGGAAALRRRM
jgi:hypothetical protein